MSIVLYGVGYVVGYGMGVKWGMVGYGVGWGTVVHFEKTCKRVQSYPL